MHPSDAAQLLPTAGSPGTAVDEHGQWRAVTGGLAGVVAVQDEQPAVPGRDAAHDVTRQVAVVSDQRTDQASLATSRKLDRLPHRRVADQRADGAEGLHFVRLGP